MQKGKSKKVKQSKKVKNERFSVEEDQENESFDFGGFPKNIDLRKNMGCGG